MALISPATFTANDEPVEALLDEASMLSIIGSDPEFNNSSYWKKIVLSYQPAGSKQYKPFTFRSQDASIKAWEKIPASSNTGTWSVRGAYVVNWAGAVLVLNSSSFSGGDDITIN